MKQESSWREPAARLIQAMDRPLLGLAIVSIILYLAELHAILPPHDTGSWYHIVMLVIDFVFVSDLALKMATLRRKYIRSPWFLIDAVSCLPVLTALPIFSSSLQSFRFVRGLRMFRVLRSLRILRLLQAMPAFRQFQEQSEQSGTPKRFERALFLGVLVFSLLFLLTIMGIKKYLFVEHIDSLNIKLHRNLNQTELRVMGGSLNPKEYREPIVLQGQVEGRKVKVYFDHDEIQHTANLVEFYLVIGALMGMLLLFYLFVHLLKDVSYQQIRGILNIVLPHQVAEQFIRNPQSYNKKYRMPGSIMFLDIKGFTRVCEQLGNDLNTLSSHLEAVMDAMTQALVEHKLIIDKFIGDSIMSFAGGPLCPGKPEENAYNMVRAALTALREIDQRHDPYFSQLKIGGASTPDCLIGAFGTSTRLSYTVLGDGVNLAARLEAACGECRTSNLFCATTKEWCASYNDIIWRCWGVIRVKGKLEPLRVYEAFDARSLPDATFIDTYHRAWDAFQAREFKQAKQLFREANKQREGGDPPSQDYIEWCKELIHHGYPDDWEPILSAKK